MTPLSGPELARLQAYVADDEVLFKRAAREQERELNRSGFGVLVACVLMAGLSIAFGHAYLEGLVNASAPHLFEHFSFLSGLIGSDYASAVYAGLGFLAPFGLLLVVSDGVVALLRGIASRSLPDAVLAFTAAAFAVSAAALLVAIRPLPALAVIAAWAVVRAVTVRLLTRRGA